MKCPLCGCVSFYVKDPDDAYETYEFDWRDGNVEFSADVDPAVCPEIGDDTEVFCDQCSWHGESRELKDVEGQGWGIGGYRVTAEWLSASGVRLSKKNCTNFVKYPIYFDYFYAGESGAASAAGFCGSLRLWMEK